jgi:hypothetical protein
MKQFVCYHGIGLRAHRRGRARIVRGTLRRFQLEAVKARNSSRHARDEDNNKSNLARIPIAWCGWPTSTTGAFPMPISLRNLAHGRAVGAHRESFCGGEHSQ